jgi:hypothetical protein
MGGDNNLRVMKFLLITTPWAAAFAGGLHWELRTALVKRRCVELRWMLRRLIVVLLAGPALPERMPVSGILTKDKSCVGRLAGVATIWPQASG